MGFITKKWNELVYTLTSNDRYAGYHSSKAVKSLTADNGINNDDINNNDIVTNNYAKFKIDDSSYSVDEKQQAQLVLDAWHIIEDVIDLDIGGDNNDHFALKIDNNDFDDDVDELQDTPDAEDFMNSLSSPCTLKDLQVAQKHLDIKLPYPVIQYFLVHDGQEIAPSSTRKLGLMYGLQLLSLAEVVTMTNYWRKVSRKEYNAKFVPKKTEMESEEKQNNNVTGDDGSTNKSITEVSILENDPNFKIINKLNKISEKDLQNYPDLMRNISTHSKNDYIKKLPDQRSFPPNKVKLQYANPNWIPLVTDNAGNHIAIDLDPDTDGTIGQVIIFGREYDVKYVIAENWGEFMNMFAMDFERADRCKLDYDNDIGQFDLVYLDKDGNVVDDGYLYVLSQRAKGIHL